MLDEIHAGDFYLACISRLLITPYNYKVRLSRIETRLLAFLMHDPERIFASEYIIENIWGYASDSALRSVIYRLRRKIELNPTNPRYLQQMGEGYGFFP